MWLELLSAVNVEEEGSPSSGLLASKSNARPGPEARLRSLASFFPWDEGCFPLLDLISDLTCAVTWIS